MPLPTKMSKLVWDSPLGKLLIEGNEDFVQKILFDQNAQTDAVFAPVLEYARQELADYFAQKRQSFSFPFQAQGTDFQQVVWKYLQKIPFGKTISYQELAADLGNPLLVRAAASANGKNPLSIVIPCHRVIGSNGKLVGYAGGLWRKQFLLDLEKTPTHLFS